jgi:hypothetical protein
MLRVPGTDNRGTQNPEPRTQNPKMELIKGQKSAILVEPTSLVGRHCLDYLLEHKSL